MKEFKLQDITNYISSGSIISHDENGKYNIYGSTGIIGKTNNPNYFGKKILIARVGANAGSCNYINEHCGISDNTLVLETNNECVSKYLFYFLSSCNLSKLVYGSGQPLITSGMLKNIKIRLPSIEEQTKIATFLNLYYKKIELQKRKIDLLNNMFKWIAKINFDINKEETCIENLVEEFIEKSYTENQYPILSSTMNGMFLQNEYFTDNVITQSNIGYKIVPYNYFTYRSMSDTGKFVFNLQRLVDKGIVSPAYPVFNVNEKCLSDFLYYYLNYSKYIKKQLLLLKEGGTRYALGFEKFKKLKVVCLTLEEQQVIVKNLDILKSKLELEKQKHETMEKYKQGLLQQLFI